MKQNLEIMINDIFDEYYIDYNIDIKIKKYKTCTEYLLFVLPFKNRGMLLNTVNIGDFTNDAEYNELRNMVIEWLIEEINWVAAQM